MEKITIVRGKIILSEEQRKINKKNSKRKYYLKNKENIIKKQREYVKNKIGKKKINSMAMEWYNKNKEKIKIQRRNKIKNLTDEQKEIRRKKRAAYRVAYRNKNRDMLREKQKQYYWKNRKSIRSKQNKYYHKTLTKSKEKSNKSNICKITEDKLKTKVEEDKLKKRDAEIIFYYINNVWCS